MQHRYNAHLAQMWQSHIKTINWGKNANNWINWKGQFIFFPHLFRSFQNMPLNPRNKYWIISLLIDCFVTGRLCSIALLNNSPPGHLHLCYIHLEFSFTNKVMYATASQTTYLDQSESKDEQVWLKVVFNYQSFLPGYTLCLQNCLIVLIILSLAISACIP